MVPGGVGKGRLPLVGSGDVMTPWGLFVAGMAAGVSVWFFNWLIFCVYIGGFASWLKRSAQG